MYLIFAHMKYSKKNIITKLVYKEKMAKLALITKQNNLIILNPNSLP